MPSRTYADYPSGWMKPDAHRGSGPQLLMYAAFQLFDVPPGEWTPYGTPLAGEAARAALIAHGLSAMLAAGAVAATFLLARELLPPVPSLVAAALVAFDPYLLGITTSAMSEPLYVPIVALAAWSVLRARRHPAWLLATGALMALGHVLRVNGLVAFVALLAFAALLLGARRRWRWLAASAVAFALVASPYLAWRATEGAGAFDYGTNQRFWADSLWDTSDAWWQAYFAGDPSPARETARDYFAKHDAGDAVQRIWESVAWQVFDLVGVGKWPRLDDAEGGRWVGTAPEGPALTPLLVLLAGVAAFVALPRRRDAWFLPILLAATFATFVWIYPLVRSVRYFSPLVPLVTVVAMLGWMHLAAHLRRPLLVGALVLGAYVALYTARLWLAAPEALLRALAHDDLRALVLGGALMWSALALAPLAHGLVARARRTPAAEGSSD